MLWFVIWGVLAVGLVGHQAVSTSRDRRIIRSLNALAAQGRHAEVIDHPLPSRTNRPAVRVMQASSAVMTGRYAVALALLRTVGSRVRGTHPGGPDLARGAALVGLGRYAEASSLLGDRPTDDGLRHLRAGVAMEVGDDEVAEDLLAEPHLDPLAEAGRLRMLGDLRLRRGRLQEAEELLIQARALYVRLDSPGVDADVAYCSVLLSRVALRAGLVEQAVTLADQGIAAMGRRPDNAPGLTEAHAVAAEATSAVGAAATAQEHLRRAHGHGARCGSPAIDAELARATAQVCLHLGQPSEARRWLHDALQRHEVLGARPCVEELRRAIASLDG